MRELKPIPIEEFAAALEDLDRTEFASFVGTLRAITADEVEVDPPIVTVRNGDTRTDLLVGSPDSDSRIDRNDVDGIVTRQTDPSHIDTDLTVHTASDLRERLVWATPVEEAESLCDTILDVPAYATTYAESVSSPGESRGDRTRPEADAPTSRRPAVVVSLLAVVVLAAGAGGIYVAGASVGGPVAGLFGGDSPVENTDTTPDGEPLDSNGTDGDTDTTAPTAGDGGEPTTDADTVGSDSGPGAELTSSRTTNPVPTCNRSFLHVVQIQMNALKYNDNTTNDGIRTVQQFATPQNRRYVGSLQNYIWLFEQESYAPMLTYDSVEYTPMRVNEDTARVEVLTRENGTTTGHYEFRMIKPRNDTIRYEGCWMTAGVRVLGDR